MKIREILDKVKPVWKPNKNYNSIKPEITVILPIFNGLKDGGFEKAVESVMNQKYYNWELIIVDDSQVDGIEDLINFYMNLDNRINTIQNTYSLGLPAVYHYQAYKKARGQYIAFIFDDNVWRDEHLLLSMKNMIKNNVKITYGNSCLSSHNAQYEYINQPLENLPINNCIDNSSVVLHREIFETVGLYDPHLSLIELYDWDLWLRIYNKYLIYKINENVTKKQNALLKDSHKSIIDANKWVAYEQIQTIKNLKLLPENYEDYDIVEFQEDSTELFCEYIKVVYSKNKHKCWYDYNAIDELPKNRISKKRILIEIAALDATYFLGFSNINMHFIIRPFIGEILRHEYLYSDAVLCIRDVLKGYRSMEFKNEFNIPTYYYIDDNFIAITEENGFSAEKNRDIFLASNMLKSTKMNRFESIIVSTENLKEDFENRYIHNNINVLPPIIDIEKTRTLNIINNQVNIAFIGGKFRENIFISKILPAIMEVSKKIQINLICTESLKEKIDIAKLKHKDNLQIDTLDTNSCYQQFMLEVEKYNVNILIHSGEDNTNNKYKTKNALINAVKIGAILITSDVDPYRECDEIITSKNTVSDWYYALDSLIFNKELCKKQYNIQKQFVFRNYSVKNGIDTFGKIFSDIDNATSIINILNRFEKMNSQNIYLENKTTGNNGIINYDFLDKTCYYREIKSTAIYKIKPTRNFSRIGIVISSNTMNNTGIIKVSILNSKDKVLAITERNIDSLQLRNINYFDFNTIIDSKKALKLKISIKYYDDNRIGVYELQSKANKIYRGIRKVFNKNLPIKDVIFYEI